MSDGMKKLATFVQISDLHIGDIDPATGNAAIHPWIINNLHRLQHLDCLIGHHGWALQDLADFVADQLLDAPDLHLIVTGDLTQEGALAQLELARNYLFDEIDLSPPLGMTCGLNWPQKALIIPGNHDHWGGAVISLVPMHSRCYQVFARRTPYVKSIPIGGERVITFISVDSDADIAPLSLTSERFRALGDFRSQLRYLHGRLPPKEDYESRIMLIHHSWFTRGWTLEILPDCRDALSRFMHENDIFVMLSGHAHQHHFLDFMVRSASGAADAHELRCGSTTQQDMNSEQMRKVFKAAGVPQGIRPGPPNSLLIHRAYAKNRLTLWETTIYIRTPDGFKAVQGLAPKLITLR